MMSRAVATFIKVVLLYTIISSIMPLGKCASDTIKSSQAISVGQNLMSANQKFELGFLSPSNSSRRYIGIWYKTIPETILWVTNRGNPLSASDESARFMLSDDGNLLILDGNQDTVWSTNISVRLSHPVAVLLETGDLVINDYNTMGSGKVAWRSFAHPSDVYVMTSQIEISTKIGDKLIKWSCWRSENDPAIGHFSGVLFPQSPVQMVVSHGEAIYWRSGPWNGLRFVGMIRIHNQLQDHQEFGVGPRHMMINIL